MAEDEPATAPKRERSRRKAGATSSPTDAAGGQPSSPAPAPVIIEGVSRATDRMDLRMTAVGRLEAGQVSVAQGAIGAARADHVSVDRGAVAAALGDRVEISRGYARSIVARQVQFDRAAARVVIAADVQANQTAVMFLVARKVSGDVKVLFDWRGALAFGAVAGLVIATLGRMRRRPR
jgi:hypothetical protein